MSQGSWGFDRDAADALRASALDVPAARTYDLAGWGRRVGGYLVDVVATGRRSCGPSSRA